MSHRMWFTVNSERGNLSLPSENVTQPKLIPAMQREDEDSRFSSSQQSYSDHTRIPVRIILKAATEHPQSSFDGSAIAIIIGSL